jgi:hypothetical protein
VEAAFSLILRLVFMKNIIKFAILVLLFSCDLPCPEINQVSDLGALPEEVLGVMPYEDGDAISFLYAGDTVMAMEVSRETRKQYEIYEDECNQLTYVYEIDVTTMTNADSMLSILAWVANLTAIDWYEVKINDSRFRIPVSPNSYLDAIILDSLQVNETVYYNVCQMARSSVVPDATGAPLVDIVYFNTAAGFLEILMADGSRYQRIE